MKSEQRSEDGKLSSSIEMQRLVHEVADFAAPSANWKDRVQAAARALGFEWARTKAFYYQDARRIDSEEMDHARAVARKLRTEDQRRKAADHVEWLRATVQSLRADGRQLDSDSLDVLERLAGVVGDEGSAMVAVAAEDEDQSLDWREG